jgi:hypothetical protein
LYEGDETKDEENYDSFTQLHTSKDPFFYVKEYNQQCSLTYHYLDIQGDIV